jgi:uncharacterized OB-fold protein
VAIFGAKCQNCGMKSYPSAMVKTSFWRNTYLCKDCYRDGHLEKKAKNDK